MEKSSIEKSFREIESDIRENGLELTFAKYTHDMLYAMQNVTRIICYVNLEYPEKEKELNAICGAIISAGIKASEVAKKIAEPFEEEE